MTTTSAAVDTMKSTASASTSATPASGSAAASDKKLKQDMGTFLTLLTTQLKFQDPLSPMDSTQFTNQLVQFSSVEQQVKSNGNLEKLIGLNQTNQTSAALSYLERTVEVDTNNIPLTGGAASFNYIIPSQANSAILTIRDSMGTVVHSATVDNMVGTHTYNWKGTDNFGFPQKDGAYEVSITALDGTGANIPVATHALAAVTGVSSNNGSTILSLGGSVDIDLSKVLGVTKTPTPAAAQTSLLDKLTTALKP